jgi:hypothetical protein
MLVKMLKKMMCVVSNIEGQMRCESAAGLSKLCAEQQANTGSVRQTSRPAAKG